MFYSAMTGGFYDEEIHGSGIPDDATHESKWGITYSELMEGNSAGFDIVPDSQGFPILSERPPLTAKQLQAIVNAESRAYLAETDWYVVRKMETGAEIPAEIIDNRTAARAKVIE